MTNIPTTPADKSSTLPKPLSEATTVKPVKHDEGRNAHLTQTSTTHHTPKGSENIFTQNKPQQNSHSIYLSPLAQLTAKTMPVSPTPSPQQHINQLLLQLLHATDESTVHQIEKLLLSNDISKPTQAHALKQALLQSGFLMEAKLKPSSLDLAKPSSDWKQQWLKLQQSTQDETIKQTLGDLVQQITQGQVQSATQEHLLLHSFIFALIAEHLVQFETWWEERHTQQKEHHQFVAWLSFELPQHEPITIKVAYQPHTDQANIDIWTIDQDILKRWNEHRDTLITFIESSGVSVSTCRFFANPAPPKPCTSVS